MSERQGPVFIEEACGCRVDHGIPSRCEKHALPAPVVAEVRRAPLEHYAHMCRDEHIQIGHNDSEHERCPLCRAKDELESLRGRLRRQEQQWREMAKPPGRQLPAGRGMRTGIKSCADDLASLLTSTEEPRG
jgi:hypothetical protein